MQKITPFLWFDADLQEVVDFYSSVFKNVTVGNVSRLGDGSPTETGNIMTAEFEIEGQKFNALKGGPMFKFNEAVSFYVNCEDQEEVDELWSKLTDGGEESQCGWLKDKYGLSWQIIPTVLPEMLRDPDHEKSQRALEAMLKMHKIDIATLRKAYDDA